MTRSWAGWWPSKYDRYQIEDQWTSYGWNVFALENGNNYDQIIAALKTMEDWDPADRRPMIVIGRTLKGYWPGAVDGKIPGYGEQLVSYPSHPYAMRMNSEYFVALAETFEKQYDVAFEGIRQGAVTDQRERLIQFKTNIDVVMSLLDRNGLGDWLADRLVAIAETLQDDLPLRIDTQHDPFQDERLRVANLPVEPQRVTRTPCRSLAPRSRSTSPCSASPETWLAPAGLFRKFSSGRTMSRTTGLSPWPPISPSPLTWNTATSGVTTIRTPIRSVPALKPPFRKPAMPPRPLDSSARVPRSTRQQFAGVWALSGTYGAFTPLMYLPARVWSQQNQDSRFRMGVLHILAGHSGPETAADARTHFGIFAPQVWKLFPRGQAIHLSFWDYNDVAPGYFAAAEIAAREAKVGIIILEVARPDFPVADRSTFADTDLKAAAKGLYVIRDFAPGQPRHGYVLVQGSSSTVNLVRAFPRLEQAGVNVKVIAAISEELFDRQPEAYRQSVLPPEARYDLMVVSTGTRRVWPISNVGPLTDEYSLTSDWDNQWLTGGLEPDVIAEAHLDTESIFAGIQRFATGAATTPDTPAHHAGSVRLNTSACRPRSPSLSQQGRGGQGQAQAT